MTPEAAAQAAADQERLCKSHHDWLSMRDTRDLYVRAFLAGAQWQQAQEEALLDLLLPTTGDPHDDTRVDPLTNSPSPSTGSTAPTDNAESPHRGKS